MNFTIESYELKNALSRVISVVERKTTNQIIGYALFEIDNDILTLSATDCEVFARVKSKVNSQISTKFCVNAKNLFEILRELKDGVLTFEIDLQSNTVSLKSNDIFYSLLIYDPSDFPQINTPESEKPIKISSQNLIEMINLTSHAISSDETRVYLNGLFFQKIDGKLRAVATDGHRLSLLDTHVDNDSNDNLIDGIIIPKKGVHELKRMADSVEIDNIELSVDDSFIYARSGDDYFISIRLIARDYPKYQAVIPAKTTFKIKADRNRFYEAIKRIRIMANDKSNQVRLNIDSTKIELSANHPSLGNAKELIPVDYDGKKMEIGFNAKYLVEALSSLSEGEVLIELNNEISPVIIKSASLPNYLGIVMPLKL